IHHPGTPRPGIFNIGNIPTLRKFHRHLVEITGQHLFKRTAASQYRLFRPMLTVVGSAPACRKILASHGLSAVSR
ncbi:hypothetical protein ACQWHR_27160, partial [Salmonella enterica subsp. enterica serovar Infantis]